MPADLRAVWFASLLLNGFALAAAGSEARFADLAADTMRTLLHDRPGLTASIDDVIESLLDGFQNLSVHPDVADGMRTLARGGLRIVTLTNGASSVGQGSGTRGLGDVAEAYLSVDDAGRWKNRRRRRTGARRRPTAPACRWSAWRSSRCTRGTPTVERAGMTTSGSTGPVGRTRRCSSPPDIVGIDLPEVAAQLLARA